MATEYCFSLFNNLSLVQLNNSRLVSKKPCNFDTNPKSGALSEKKQPKTPAKKKKTAKMLIDQIQMAF